MSLKEYGFEGKLIETPGHTNGSISVVLEDGNIFIGDLINGGMLGKGKPKFPMFAVSLEKTKDSIRKVLALSPKMFYCGHGGPFNFEELKSFANNFDA